MRAQRPQRAASNPRGRRFGASMVRVLSVTAVAATACAMMAGAASAATAAPAAAATTTTTITNTNPGTVDAGVAYTIDVTVTSTGGTPTGTVSIAPTAPTGLPASYSCTATLSGGSGSCQVTPGAGTFGDVTYAATYAGNATFGESTSGAFTLVVPETTTTSVSPATASPGAVTLTATVVGQAKGNISPPDGDGTVAFYNGDTVIAGCADATLTYDGGGANLAKCTTTLAAGTYTINANYSGDLNNLKSPATETLIVKGSPPPVKHATTTRGSAKPASTKLRRVVTLSATVTSSGGTPGGKVTFMWRGRVVCSARLSHGKAHCSIIFLKAGTYRIRAWYSGSSTFDGSHSAFFAVTIKK
jgi:hypothetical protein